ncbi:hypothetical protein E2562_029239 [Oryza meyeriana var. granulata]|uniref:Uncharacterized protein n=1 Tax=Oryza meyeriana var. granulata TaxID=110450 RepID=A0A6G1EQV7_9ORYZ|nr:hypothetical protein E2562_029239 [Oryza meyeriana var. granulata]
MSDSTSYSDDSDELAPTKIIEEHVAEQSVLDSFARRIAMKIKAAFLAGVPQRQYGPRKSIRRDHGGAHERLVEDYFAAEPLYPERPCYDVVIAAGATHSHPVVLILVTFQLTVLLVMGNVAS